MDLEKNVSEKTLKSIKTADQYKELFRTTSIPDSRRREMILQMFDLFEDKCEIKYNTKKELLGKEDLE